MLTLPKLTELIESAERSIFRLEALPRYNVTAADRDVARYLAGEDPDMDRKQRWLDTLRARADRGVEMRRVRVLRLPLSDYDRMVCEWGYVHNSKAGEDIRVFELTCDDSSQVARSAQSAEDFYVLDQHIALLMDYTDDGEFSGAEKTSAAGAFEELAGMYWLAAEPFEQWWAAHPEYHRNTVGR